jgi:alginate O-acetyltransferase complex protein AlgI
VMIADSIAPVVATVFDTSKSVNAIKFLDGWIGATGYGLQLYFDFSGYSDMAIGLALMFGIAFPLNFNSPYKAHSIIDFWRRWNMTLSRFLRDYLYIPLGGNRNGPIRRYVNIMVTMLLGGLWHGGSGVRSMGRHWSRTTILTSSGLRGIVQSRVCVGPLPS